MYQPLAGERARNPLYDPVRDRRAEQAEQSITAKVMGDPEPGRRELVAGNHRDPAPSRPGPMAREDRGRWAKG
jgi:hypothetical protein